MPAPSGIALCSFRLAPFRVPLTLRIACSECCGVIVSGLVLFVGGNRLISWGLGRGRALVTAVMVAAAALWVALMEWRWPGGARLSGRGWLGLLIGLGGVSILLGP